MNNRKHNGTAARDGFALVVAMSLMVFILLLALALSSLMRVEVSATSTNQLQMLARQNALLALSIAIGNLQAELGPDQRVSAQANILTGTAAPSDAARHWTGVWNTDASHPDYAEGERIAWLVSGSPAPDDGHQDRAESDWVTLFGTGLSLDDPERIRLPRVSIGDDGLGSGGYAWWVSDEGVKVRYNSSTNALDGESDDNGDLRLASPAHADIASFALLKDYAIDTMSPEKVLDFASLPFLHGASALKSRASTDRARLAHSLSFSSLGLLTDVRHGGLKRDLTVLFEGDDALPSLGVDLPDLNLLKSFYLLKEDVTDSGAEASISPRVQTDTEHGIIPIVVSFAFNFGFAPSQYADPATVLVTMRPIIVLANPYNIQLSAADYAIRWEPGTMGSVPRVAVRVLGANGSGSTASFTLPLDTLLGPSVRFQIPSVSFAPGEVKVFTLDGSVPIGLSSAGVPMVNDGTPSGAYVWVDSGQPLAIGATRNTGGMAMRAGYNDFVLEVNGVDGQRIENVFSPGTYLGVSATLAVSMDDVGGSTPDSILWGVPNRFILKVTADDRNSFGPSDSNTTGTFSDTRGSAWLVAGNARSPHIAAPTSEDYLWDGNANYVGVYQSGGGANISHFLVDHVGTRAFWGWGRDAVRGSEYVTLFEVPRRPLLSLGQLQHANVGSGGEPSYIFGNSWASPFEAYSSKDIAWRMNEAIWDSYYFSGYDAVSHRWQNPRIQPIMRELTAVAPVLADAKSISSALGVKGMFNVNSTNVEAWRAQLASLRDRAITYLSSEGGSTSLSTYVPADINVPLPRTSLPAGGAFTPTAPEDATALAMWNGFRDLTDGEINALAGQIVYHVKQRGPFLSLASFVNRDLNSAETGSHSPRQMGVLQAAIDAKVAREVDGVSYPPTGINTKLVDKITSPSSRNQHITGTAAEGLPNYSAVMGLSRSAAAPGYLTQADVLTLMGSFISVRSDTFTIRAYGDTGNLANGGFASAVCEAVVQRIPTPVEPGLADADEPLDRNRFGRQFIILSVRWLSNDEV